MINKQMDGSDKLLTHEEHRIISDDILTPTKDLTGVTFKIIGEYIENRNKNL